MKTHCAAWAGADNTFESADMFAAQGQVEGGDTLFAGAKLEQERPAMGKRYLRLWLQRFDAGFA